MKTGEADEAVRDARQAVYRVDQGRQLACQQVTPMSDDLNLEAALDAYESAIRASERAKVDTLVAHLLDHHQNWTRSPTCVWNYCPLVDAADVVRVRRAS